LGELDVGAGLNRPTNETVQKAGGYLAQFITGPATTLSSILDDYLKHIRVRNGASLEHNTRQHLAKLGYEMPPRKVPIKVALPLIQAATLEEDEELQSIWAALLANASTPEKGESVSPAFVEILRSMGRTEVRTLIALYEAGEPGTIFYSRQLPDVAEVYDQKGFPSDRAPLPSQQVQTAVWNLARLGCIAPESMSDGAAKAALISVSPLGAALVEACTIRPPSVG
jgi:hypothetical protein